MSTQYRCKNEPRQRLVRDTRGANGRPLLNGIDYLTVAADRQTLAVYFIHTLPGPDQQAPVPASNQPLSGENVSITGGIRLQDIQVESVTSFGEVLRVRVNQIGDFSPYTLRLVKSPSDPTPPEGFDPQLSQVEFSFWVEESSEFDCQPPAPLPEKEPPPPVIDYLAKDYASFRRLMLDRLAVTTPQWKERNPADLGVMLVEVLAYAADHLSYYQDAVATEAYLGTARKRVSVRRHARLLDYLMHDGCNARTWVAIQLDEGAGEQIRNGVDGLTLLGPAKEKNRPGVKLLTRTNLPSGVLPNDKFETALNAGAQVFETLHDVTLYYCLNTIYFYTWGDEQCRLPKQSTQATLRDPLGLLQNRLTPGSVLIFEEILGPESGDEKDADPTHRHVVRLTQVKGAEDPLPQRGDKVKIVEVEWSPEDALPFDLFISNVNPQGKPITDEQGELKPISVARGNVVLADAGCTIPKLLQKPGPLKKLESLWHSPGWDRLRPGLQEGPLTQQGYVLDSRNLWVVFDPKAPASQAMQWKLRDARPAIALWENTPPDNDQDAGPLWRPQRDLLNSDRFARDFVVETEDDGRAYLRFGDDLLGRKPDPDTRLYAAYRIGNGRLGNVGAEAIGNILILSENLEAQDRHRLFDIQVGLETVRNPLPAEGGEDPEPIEQVRLYAPQAFKAQRRAVTAADYAMVAKRYPGVQKALATRRWTGSWRTIFITVDRTSGFAVDDDFKQGLRAFLEEFRLAGHDIEIDGPRFVSLDIAMTVLVEPDYFRSAVKQALLDSFSNRVLANGQLGFFHPDRFSFGDSVYLSQVVSRAMQTAGVSSVNVTRFKRWGEPPNRELETGQIQFERLEIARLDNAPNAPENGKIEFNLEGGL